MYFGGDKSLAHSDSLLLEKLHAICVRWYLDQQRAYTNDGNSFFGAYLRFKGD